MRLYSSGSESSDSQYEYDSDDSFEDNSSDSDSYIPRRQMIVHQEAHGQKMKFKQNGLNFTKGTTPLEKDCLKFMLGQEAACPQFLPMTAKDAIVSSIVM
jgi:hypothetical protein